MKKILTLSILFSIIVLSACTNADPKKMANDLCDCVKTQKKLSSKAKKILVKSANSGDFATTLQEEIQAIDDEEKKTDVNDEIQGFLKEISSDDVKECANAIDKKYKVAKSDEKDMQKKLVDAMDDVTDCEAYAAVVRAGMKKQSGETTDSEKGDQTNDEEPVKKKKTSTDEE